MISIPPLSFEDGGKFFKKKAVVNGFSVEERVRGFSMYYYSSLLALLVVMKYVKA